MSHYCCAVFAYDTWDFPALLEPYDENNEKYFVFEPISEEELRKRYAKFLEQNPDWEKLGFDYYLEQQGYENRDGIYGISYNPNGIWDWYSLDGKDYLFDCKRGKHPDIEGNRKKSVVDFFAIDKEAEKEARVFWNEYVLGKNPDAQDLFKREYYLERYKTEDEYAKFCRRTIPYCFITPDGKLHEPGRVGWFASSDETPESWDAYVKEFDDFILNAPDCYVSFVDLHI